MPIASPTVVAKKTTARIFDIGNEEDEEDFAFVLSVSIGKIVLIVLKLGCGE